MPVPIAMLDKASEFENRFAICMKNPFLKNNETWLILLIILVILLNK
jgi:hypothetical protein